jgi:hypothetical protein
MNWQALMLPNETEFKHTGNLIGEEVKMSFDENSLDFLADVLINLYSDKELAVIREYSTNARDSHIAAGQTRPIEISTPNYLSYNFKVKDYGIGLSKDDIYNIYSKYGASTKRETNQQVGMLGLGCKAALTYCDGFNIVSVKDGIKINVIVERSENGGGQMSILSETKTNEPNGVEIIVPVSKNNGFAKKCRDFFQFWSEDEVLVDGKPPSRPELRKVTDRIYLKQNLSYYEKSYVVMGGVSYEIDTNQIKLPPGFIAYVDIGEVSFTPSREYLHYTQKTKNTLERLHNEYSDNILKAIQAEIDNENSKFEIARIFDKWKKTLQGHGIIITVSDFTHKGKPLNIYVDFDGKWSYGQGFINKNQTRWGIKGVSIDVLESYTIVKGFTAEKLTSYQKQKLTYWAEQNGKKDTFYFCDEVPGDGWLDDVTQVIWSDILALKLPSNKSTSKSDKPTYEVYHNGKFLKIEELDKTKSIWHSTKNEWREITESVFKMDKWFSDIQFVFVGANRLKKFNRLYPGAIPLQKGLYNYIDSYVGDLTQEEKTLITSDAFERSKFAQLDIGRVVDPELQALIESSNKNDEIIELQAKWEDMLRLSWKVGYTVTDRLDRKSKTKWVYSRYPLLNSLITNLPYNANSNYWNHVYLYFNSAYNAWKVQNEGVE